MTIFVAKRARIVAKEHAENVTQAAGDRQRECLPLAAPVACIMRDRMTASSKQSWLDALAAFVLAIVPLVLYRKIVRLWWTYDDPFHLRRVIVYDYPALFFDRPLWHGIPARVFTPLLLASMKFDYARFGLNARAFYLHQLIAFAIIPVMFYFFLRLWLTRAWSFAAALTSILAPPMIEIVQQIMLRHYVEGISIAIGAAILAVIGFRRDDRRFTLASAALYLVAMSAKEVFVPLPFVLAVMPEGDLRRRLKHLLPHGILLALYSVWRTVMLGQGVKPYGWTLRPNEWPLVLTKVPVRVLKQFVATGGAAGIVMVIALLVCIVIATLRLRGAIFVALMAAAAAVLPIVPLAVDMKVRFGLMSWIVAILGAAFISRTNIRPAISAMLFGIVMVCAVLVNRAQWSSTYRFMKRMSDETRTVRDLAPDELLRDPATPPPTMDEMIALYNAKGRALYDDRPLCDGSLNARRLFNWDPGMHVVREIQRSELDPICKSIRVEPLRADLTVEDGVLFWNLGPYPNGQYSFIFRDGFQSFDVRPRLGYRLEHVPVLPLIVRYRSPDGWTTYSPQLVVDFEHPKPIHWERK